MKRLLPLIVLVLIPAPSAALADGCPPSSCGTTSSALPGSRMLFVRPVGPQGPLRAYDLVTGARRYSLPPGRLSADGRVFVAAAPAKAKRTTVARFDAQTGRPQRAWSLPGHWSVGGVSADGRRFALVKYERGEVVIKVASSRRELHGMYEVEGLSPDGRRIFLVHWRTHGYDLQQLDLATGLLSPTRLDDPDEKMSGTAITAVATTDGRWLLTLYAKDSGGSFVHALNLGTGVAHCIDLSLRGDYFALGSTALTLSPDERRLYLANPYLGRVTTVDLEKLEQTQVVRFRRLGTEVDLSVGPSGAVTPNGRMLAFSGGSTVWLYDTAFGLVRRPRDVGSTPRGLGFRPDGRALVVLRFGSTPVRLDAATGAPLN